jgi:hypothetical protein
MTHFKQENYYDENETNRKLKFNFLMKNVIYGCKINQTKIDWEGNRYYSENDFELILQRTKKLDIGIHGIECFLYGNLYDVKVEEEFRKEPTDPTWYESVFNEFQNIRGDFEYSATFYVPDRYLDQIKDKQ